MPSSDDAGTTTGADWRRAALTMFSPLGAIIHRRPLTVPLTATVRQALEALERSRLGAIVVADPRTQVPLGIFTLRDLVRRVTLPGGDLEQPVAAVMTSGLISLEPRTSAHQAALEMARHGVRHVVVVEGDGRLVGVVSRDDLFGLQRVGVEELGDEIQAARDLEGLRGASVGIRRLADGLLARGIGVETLTHFITTLDDLLTIRIIELTADEFDLPGVPMCWLALGSAGRLEQTFSTDQDNALIFDAADADAESVRQALLPYARAVNQKLDACGFPRCPGNIMAGNPRWCLTVAEWRRTFARWIQEPDLENLVESCTFFDFRPVYGQAALAERLRDRLLAEVAEYPLFLQRLAGTALETRPPLGTVRDFVYDGATPFRRTIDLKMSGSRLFCDAARVLGLARGVAHTSTAQRLRAVADTGLFGTESVAGIIDGFHFVHLLRLRNQRAPRRPRVGPNRIYPRDLNGLDRQILKEAFRQARKLQNCLVMEYQQRT
jgi:CBS domain-containing protein